MLLLLRLLIKEEEEAKMPVSMLAISGITAIVAIIVNFIGRAIFEGSDYQYQGLIVGLATV